jgi:hypothetical protein
MLLSTGPILTSPLQHRNSFVYIDKIQDESQPVIISRLQINFIERETPSYYSNTNDARFGLTLIIDGGLGDLGVRYTLEGTGGSSKTVSRGVPVVFDNLDEQANTRIVSIYDIGLNLFWRIGINIAAQTVTFRSTIYRPGNVIAFPVPIFVAARLQIVELKRETPNSYSNADDARIRLRYILANAGNTSLAGNITMKLTNSTIVVSNFNAQTASLTPSLLTSYLNQNVLNEPTNITKTLALSTDPSSPSAKSVPFEFAPLNEGIGQRLLNITDEATGFSWWVSVDIKEQKVTFGNKDYTVGDIIDFPLLSYKDDAGVNLVIKNIRTGIISLTANGKKYEPVNKPPIGNILRNQTFQISGFDGNMSRLYPISFYDPTRSKTYTLSATFGFRPLEQPLNPLRSAIYYRDVKYTQGDLIKLT